jgi:hypothetical protein
METLSLPIKVANLLTRKGQIVTLKTVRELKMKKGAAVVSKISRFQARIGCNYDNLAAVKEKRADGTLPSENQGLPWGEWLVPNYVIEHKGKLYFRCTAVHNDASVKEATFVDSNGNVISKEVALQDALASERVEREELDVFNIVVDNIVEVNGQPL